MAGAIRLRKFISHFNGLSSPIEINHQPFEQLELSVREIHQPFQRLQLSVREIPQLLERLKLFISRAKKTIIFLEAVTFHEQLSRLCFLFPLFDKSHSCHKFFPRKKIKNTTRQKSCFLTKNIRDQGKVKNMTFPGYCFSSRYPASSRFLLRQTREKPLSHLA